MNDHRFNAMMDCLRANPGCDELEVVSRFYPTATFEEAVELLYGKNPSSYL